MNNWTEADGGAGDREFFLVYTPTGSASSYSYQFLSGFGDTNGFANVTVSFQDGAAAGSAPIGQPIASNSTYMYLPTVGTSPAYSQNPGSGLAAGNSNFAAPFGTATLASVFNGLPANGTWTLYVYDPASGDSQASIAGGWAITITATAASTTSTVVSSSVAEAFIGDSVTFTAAVSNTANSGSSVNEGLVTFTDTATGTVLGSSAVSNGTATLADATFSVEGTHNVSGQYNGDSNFGPSSSSTNVFIDHATSSSGATFCNTGTNLINTVAVSAAAASIYPQHVFVSDLTGSLTGLSLQLSNMQNVVLPDLNVLLVGPSGTTDFVALAGAGSALPSGGSLTLSDFGAPLPAAGASAGPYLPTDASTSFIFGSPVPAGPYAQAQPQGSATFATTFASELNGPWSLYVYDTQSGDSSSFGGYCLTFTTSSVASTTLTLNASAAVAQVGEPVVFTALVTSNQTAVTSGAVIFKENGNVISGPTAVDGNGEASYQTSTLSEGLHTITAIYSGVAGMYNVSSTSATVEVDTPTTAPSPGAYCNTGGITFATGGISNPYPSRVNVTNLPGTVNAVSITLNSLSNSDPAGIGMLLTGPSATNIVLWDQAGSSPSVNGDNITLDDAAGSGNSIAFPLPGSGSYTYLPTAASAAAGFPAPAPSNPSYASPAGTQTLTSAFQNLNGNGYWSLYTYGTSGQTGSIGSWCLNFTENPPVLSVAVSGPTTLTQGQTGAQYAITLTNNGPGPTGGAAPISVSEVTGSGLTVTSMSGTGWDCSNLPVCTNSAVVSQGGTSTITASISVSNDASSAQTNNASVSGGGSAGSVTGANPLSITILVPTTTAASNATVPFSSSSQNVNLSATVTANGATVNGGTVTFTIFNAGTQLGSAVTSGAVTNGAASVIYSLPGGTPAGVYTIQAAYNPGGNFTGATDTAHTLTVNGPTTIVAANAFAVYSSGLQNVALSATVTSTAGAVNAGTVTFSVYNGTALIGTPAASSLLTNGTASVSYVVPAFTAAGTYTIQASYSGGGISAASSDFSHTLIISGATTTTKAGSTWATFAPNGQNISVSATMSSSIGPVSAGAVTFTISSGATIIGSPVTANTNGNGSASATYWLPGGTGAGIYSIQAVYTGGGNFAGSSDSGGTLTVGQAATTLVASGAATSFSPNSQSLNLSATVLSPGTAVNNGTVTFTVLSNGTPLGSAVTSGAIMGGNASAAYSLPGGVATGIYTIQASYSGGGNFAGTSDSSQFLIVGGAATTTTAKNVSSAFSLSAQNIALSATVTSTGGIVNSGSVSFTVLTPVASTVMGNVINGTANVTYSVPAGTPAGGYTIQAVYNAAGNFATGSDVTHNLTVLTASTTTAANSAAATFSSNTQNLTLSAIVSSAAGNVNSGTVTFTVLSYGTVVGTAVSASVVNGSASAIYSLPGGTPEGAYAIQASYSGGGNYSGSSESAHTLSIGPAMTTTLGSAAVAGFSSNAQNVTFSAIVTSTAGTVNAGTVTFTLLNGGMPVGTPVNSGTVTNGTASVAYLLPGGIGIGAYTILAAYNAGWDFSSSSDGTHSLTVIGAATTTAANNAAAGFSANAQSLVLSAAVTSAAGTVNGGTVTFTVWNGNTELGSPATSASVTNGIANAIYVLPGNTPAGTYVIQAAYSGGGSFAASSDAPVTLTVMAQTGALMFIPVTPCRVADSRDANGPFGGPQLTAGSTRSFAIPSSSCGIPSTALAYSMNATVVPSTTLSYLTMWPAGQPQPNVSTLNSFDGRIKANAAVVPAGANGAVSVYVTDATQVILDIDGYFVPAGTASSLAFYPMTPCRIADTRSGTGPLAGPSLSAGAIRSFPILSSSCNVPSTAQAYSLNFTAVPSGSLGYLTTWATGQPQPNVSTLNDLTGTVTANAAIVPAGTSGSISVYSSDATNLVMDIDGYFAPPGTGGLSLYTLAPCRVLDTRNPAGAQPFNGTLSVNVAASACSVPVAAKAYGLNATVVPPGYLSYLTLWPDGKAQPWVSTLNAFDGAITSNMAIVPATNGVIDAYASNPTHLILDISSYYAP